MGATGPRIEKAVRETPASTRPLCPSSTRTTCSTLWSWPAPPQSPGDIIILSPPAPPLTSTPTLRCAAASSRRSSTRSSDRTGRGCSAVPGSRTPAGKALPWGRLLPLARASAKASRAGSSPGQRWRWTWRQHGLAGGPRQPRTNWPAFCISAAARASFWTSRVPAAYRLAQAVKSRFGLCRRGSSCPCPPWTKGLWAQPALCPEAPAGPVAEILFPGPPHAAG